jgi:hypothetical protein
MADDESVPGTPEAAVPPEPASEPPAAAEPAPAPAPVLKTRWRDRAWTFRAMLAVAAASLVIGGVVGGVIGASAGGDDDDYGYRMGPGGPGMKMPPGWRHGDRGPNGPKWRWNDGPQQAPSMTPYGGTSPSAPTTPSPTS